MTTYRQPTPPEESPQLAPCPVYGRTATDVLRKRHGLPMDTPIWDMVQALHDQMHDRDHNA